MTVDDWAKLIDSIAKLCGAIFWPALIVTVLVLFAPALRIFSRTFLSLAYLRQA